jgi:hypothetical protein
MYLSLIFIFILIILICLWQIILSENTLLSILLFLEIINLVLICLILIRVKSLLVFSIVPLIIFILRNRTLEAFVFFFVLGYQNLQELQNE